MAKNVYQSINHFKLQHKRVFFYQLIDSVTLMQRIANIFLQLNDIFYQPEYLSSCADGEGINEWSHILWILFLPAIVRTIIKPPAAARRGAAHYHIMIISRNPEIWGRPTKQWHSPISYILYAYTQPSIYCRLWSFQRRSLPCPSKMTLLLIVEHPLKLQHNECLLLLITTLSTSTFYILHVTILGPVARHFLRPKVQQEAWIFMRPWCTCCSSSPCLLLWGSGWKVACACTPLCPSLVASSCTGHWTSAVKRSIGFTITEKAPY